MLRCRLTTIEIALHSSSAPIVAPSAISTGTSDLGAGDSCIPMLDGFVSGRQGSCPAASAIARSTAVDIHPLPAVSLAQSLICQRDATKLTVLLSPGDVSGRLAARALRGEVGTVYSPDGTSGH
eukprot:COSAG06_NODE_28660_length_570_cov_0.861996_1_plen_123_part_10